MTRRKTTLERREPSPGPARIIESDYELERRGEERRVLIVSIVPGAPV